jgi:hypothetical protein
VAKREFDMGDDGIRRLIARREDAPTTFPPIGVALADRDQFIGRRDGKIEGRNQRRVAGGPGIGGRDFPAD